MRELGGEFVRGQIEIGDLGDEARVRGLSRDHLPERVAAERDAVGLGEVLRVAGPDQHEPLGADLWRGQDLDRALGLALEIDRFGGLEHGAAGPRVELLEPGTERQLVGGEGDARRLRLGTERCKDDVGAVGHAGSMGVEVQPGGLGEASAEGPRDGLRALPRRDAAVGWEGDRLDGGRA